MAALAQTSSADTNANGLAAISRPPDCPFLTCFVREVAQDRTAGAMQGVVSERTPSGSGLRLLSMMVVDMATSAPPQATNRVGFKIVRPLNLGCVFWSHHGRL